MKGAQGYRRSPAVTLLLRSSMNSAFSRLRSLLLRFRSSHTINANELPQPFYEAPAPWWSRATWVFIAADLITTSSMSELTWRRWTRPADATEKAQGVTDPVLRPVWERAGLVVGHVTFGIGFAVALFVGRSRVVRRLYLLNPPPTSPKAPQQLFIQGAHNRDTRGVVAPFKSTRISPGRDDSEVVLRVDGMRGHWWVGLTRAKIDGHEMGKAPAREAFLRVWGIRKGSPVSSAWVGGPVVHNL
ncbi:hypothetical protein BV25DRAFT_837714 [Artomyces pyxidatus]|uniref:Uncharacterized protein n=1 Tax=Artomyces pyxidatus TaxID=48021 RepID=A0ACB8TGS2_9AGAM|nr:hypothetical protein BV25DRAFT_837714 [Artomyces pyxidatus]